MTSAFDFTSGREVAVDLDDALKLLRERNQPVPEPGRLPTVEEVETAERDLGLNFHPDYRRFQLEASDVNACILEPALVFPDAEPYVNLRTTAREAWDQGVDRDVLPFCEDNGNYWFIDAEGRVGFWDHEDDSPTDEGTLAEWIVEVWLEGE